MLKVTITEKGGTEKVLFFEDTDEVTLGRLQTNRISLSKPNVSKRHAVLTLRDGRVFVEDLGSTNGTYVNGRRITAAREIGPRDRIYIGDFTIRVRPVSSRDEESEPEILVEPSLSVEEQRRPTVAMAMPPAGASPMVAEPAPAPREAARGPAPETPPMPPPEELSGTDAVPLDLDIEVLPAETSAPVEAGAARPPVEPSLAPAEKAADLTPVGTLSGLPGEAPSLTRRMTEAAAPAPETDRYMVALKAVAERAAREVFDSVPADQSEFSDEEWQALSDRVLSLVDRMRRENVLPADIDAYQTTQDILDDFAGLGPLEELLQDPSVRRILVDGPGRLSVTRGGQTTRVRRTFAGNTAMSRVLAKLFGLAGVPPDSVGPVTEARLPEGTHLMVLRPPLVADHVVLVLNRPGGSLLAASDLVQAGVMSEEVFRVIERAIRERGNVVVCGAPSTGKLTFLNALVHLLPDEARVVVIERNREITLPRDEAIRLSKDYLSCGDPRGSPCLVTRLFPDTVIVSDLDAEDARLVTALGLTGQKGILASLTATSADLCLHRLEMLVAFASPSVDAAIVRAFVRRFVDLIVVLDLDGEGRPRVTQVVALEDGEPRRIV